MDDFIFPEPPIITDDLLNKCREIDDFTEIIFEYYKYIGILANYYASIQLESKILKPIKPINFAILTGLLNRCSRLMLANMRLSHDGLFGESTSIIDRSIYESVVKIMWLSKTGEEENFRRYLADGLKSDIEFKRKILEKIKNRSGSLLKIEKRMIDSIDKKVIDTGMSEEEISNTKKLPHVASMVENIGFERLLYIVGQKIGSHHVHGTWSSLILHYLEEDNGIYTLRDHNCPTHINQFYYISVIVIQSIISYVEFICKEIADANILTLVLKALIDQLKEYETEFVKDDFELYS